MISAALLTLALALHALVPGPARAVSLAECQAWLCLPAGFSTDGGTPTNACDAAHDAVIRRLQRGMDPLPRWSSCAARFGWDAANLAWQFPTQQTCPNGGQLTNGMCHGEDDNGCRYSYTPREHGHVGVLIDGAVHGYQLPWTVADAGTTNVDLASCREIPDQGGGGDCPPHPQGTILWTDANGVTHCLPNPGFFSVN